MILFPSFAFGSTKSLVVDTSRQLVYTSTSKTYVAPGKLANWNEWSKPTSNILLYMVHKDPYIALLQIPI